MPPVAFDSTGPVRFAKGELGLYFAWGAFSKVDGEDFWDSHGHNMPEDDLVEGALSLARSGLLKVEHAGDGAGEVPLVMPLTTDIKKALGIESANSGIVVGFLPDAVTKSAIDAGEITEMSIAGVAFLEAEPVAVAKSTQPAAATGKRYRLRKPVLNEISVLKHGAHGAGTKIAIAKRAAPHLAPIEAVHISDETAQAAIAKNADAIRALLAQPAQPAPVAKRAPALTDPTLGHQHLVYDVEVGDGTTSYEVAAGSEYGHCHPFVRLSDGSISIGEAAGHTHTLTNPENAAMADDLAKSLTAAQADLTKSRNLVAVAVSLPPEQASFAKRLQGDALDAFLAKSDAERAALAKPVHVAKSGEVYFASDDPRLVSMAKTADAQAEIIAKQAEDAQFAEISKSAATIPAFGEGAALIVKAIRGHKLTADEQGKAMAQLATGNASILSLTKGVGYSGPVPDESSPAAQLDALAKAEQAKTPGLSFAKAYDAVLETPAGAALYAADQAAKPRATA